MATDAIAASASPSVPGPAASMRCPSCGYALEGLPSLSCPECVPASLPPPPSLTQRAATGFALMTAQMVVTRILGILGNLVLAWLLLPADFGLMAMATTALTLATLVQSIGIRDVLVQRQSSYKHLANAGFWMSLSTGLIAGVLLLISAPICVWFYHEPRVLGLILVLAVAAPIANISLVPEARLQIDLRFKWIAVLNMISTGSTVILTVVFAKLGCGAYSFVLPRLVTAILRTALAWKLARFSPRPRLQLDRWKYMLGNSLWVLVSSACVAILLAADTIMLGNALSSADDLGLYSFASMISIQAIVLLSTNLSQILFPALSKLGDQPERQAAAAVRAMRVLGMIIIPTCILQAAVAAPLIRAVFPAKWEAAIPTLQILSLAMAMRFYSVPAGALFGSQGRFKPLAFIMMASVGLYLFIVAPAVYVFRTIEAAAVAVSIWAILVEPAMLYLGLRPAGRGVRDVVSTFAIPLALALSACGLGWITAKLLEPHLPGGRVGHVAAVAIISVIASPIILLGTRLLMRPTWDEAAAQLGPFLRRVFKRPAPQSAGSAA